MAIYGYKCGDCEHEFEKMCPMSESSLSSTCPECNGRGRRVLSSSVAIIYKTDGFYTTDSKKENKKKDKKENKKED